jgi:cysteinyl-tRNA synthetase
VNVWLHSEFLLVDGGKMSKSLGNFYRISDLKEMGFTPECIRYQLLAGHYRSKITFSADKKHEGDKIVQKITDLKSRLKKRNSAMFADGSYPEEYSEFKERMNDDLNAPRSFAVFFDWMKIINSKLDQNNISEQELGQGWEFIQAFDKIFGLIKSDQLPEIPIEITHLANQRDKARKMRDWAEADSLRQILKSKGWIVEDTPNGQQIKKQS